MQLLPGKLFPVGGPVSEKDIVDREDFITSLQIRLGDGQSVMLAGPRRIGKTSIAYEVLRRLKEQGFYTASVDFFRLSNKREFAVSLINACLENRTGIRKTLDVLKDRAKAIAGMAKLTIKLEDLEFGFGFLHGEPDENALLDYALDLPEILATRDGRNMVVLFDEFQDASRVVSQEEIYKKMRSHFQNHKNVSYLFLGSKEGIMKALFSNRKEAFYRFAVILPIPSIPEDSWVTYITRKFAEQNIEVDSEITRGILQKTGGHPQDTMLVCSEIYYALLEAGKNTVTPKFVQLGYDRALLILAQIYDEILDELSQKSHVREVLKRIAAGNRVYSRKANPNEIKRALDYLMAKAIIEKDGRGSYKFVEPMFQEYILGEHR
ncbi:AAA family ATPase [Desulfofundulus thermocisternus]|uniref:AAA family ATPase n=1 Tax=Desulfofundulus thermocisternus TaxID=42471 RepID=UPI001FA6C087|nr:ATP-binding protein [Desulfofundulus thermocisternus]